MFIRKLQTLHGIAETIRILCSPLKIFKVNTENIKIMVCISLSVIPMMKRNLLDIKEACIAKSIPFKIKNIKVIMTKYLLTSLSKVNELEESLEAKGYSSE